jgi:toxin YoeB
MNVSFTPTALDDLRYWLKTDKRQAERVLALLEEVRRTPFQGAGKPEPLRFQLAGCWSRRIDREHRLVYLVEEKEIVVIACRYHYAG